MQSTVALARERTQDRFLLSDISPSRAQLRKQASPVVNVFPPFQDSFIIAQSPFGIQKNAFEGEIYRHSHPNVVQSHLNFSMMNGWSEGFLISPVAYEGHTALRHHASEPEKRRKKSEKLKKDIERMIAMLTEMADRPLREALAALGMTKQEFVSFLREEVADLTSAITNLSAVNALNGFNGALALQNLVQISTDIDEIENNLSVAPDQALSTLTRVTEAKEELERLEPYANKPSEGAKPKNRSFLGHTFSSYSNPFSPSNNAQDNDDDWDVTTSKSDENSSLSYAFENTSSSEENAIDLSYSGNGQTRDIVEMEFAYDDKEDSIIAANDDDPEPDKTKPPKYNNIDNGPAPGF